MKTAGIFTVILIGLSSCTTMVLNEMRGGHSPMMQLDGEWNIDRNIVTIAGTTTENTDANKVYFDATQDKGGRCVGTWLNLTNNNVDPEFLWGFNDYKGEDFILVAPNEGEVIWHVIKQDKDEFIIERSSGDEKYHIEFSR